MLGKYLKNPLLAIDRNRVMSKAPKVKIKAGIPKASVNSTQALWVETM
jgi:hypothetical protein